jgi:hypothetical protein
LRAKLIGEAFLVVPPPPSPGGVHTFLLIVDLAIILPVDKLPKNIVDC